MAGSTKVCLIWSDPFDGGGSILNYTMFSGSNSSMMKPLMDVSVCDCAIDNLINENKYYFAVQAMNTAGSSILTDVVVVKPLSSPIINIEHGLSDVSITWKTSESGNENTIWYVVYLKKLYKRYNNSQFIDRSQQLFDR
jgi:hypothetical protein